MLHMKAQEPVNLLSIRKVRWVHTVGEEESPKERWPAIIKVKTKSESSCSQTEDVGILAWFYTSQVDKSSDFGP